MSAALQFPALARAAAAQRQVVHNRNCGPHEQAAAAAVEPEAESAPASPLRGSGPQRKQISGPPQPGLAAVAPLEVSELCPESGPEPCEAPDEHDVPTPNLAFYRKHTETLLRRYLYASMLVGRAPAMLMEPLMRGFASYRPVETFEDSVIFVIDMESALARLSPLDRLLLTKVVLQEYSVAEAALLLNRAHRIVYRRLWDALDRLTRILLNNGTLQMPQGARARQVNRQT